MEPIPIRRAIERVANGQLRIPAFQRGFVWDAERVAYLMDSIYKGYPFGSLILWRTKTPLRTERNLGPFKLQPGEEDYPTDYVLDGQQRLTSIFGVFQTELEPEPGTDAGWTNIYFDLDAQDDLQESQFVNLEVGEATPDRYFPINTFFDSVKYREATRDLPDDKIAVIDGVQRVFQEASIPAQLMETDDRAKVAIVFERVNRLGVELDTLQLLSAWTWSEEFDLQERFANLADELAPFGFASVGEDTNLLLRACSAVVAGDISSSTLLGLNGTEVRDRFDEIENGMRGAIDFLRRAVHVERLANLPFPTLLIPLAKFFAAPDGNDLKVSQAQRDILVRWFWRAAMSRRYSGDVQRRINTDVTAATKLRSNGTSDLADVPYSIDKDWFLDNSFSFSAVNTKTFILMLAAAKPRSFISADVVDLGSVLKTYNRAEFHHIFPRRFLKSTGIVEAREANKLANFAMISAADNRAIGGRPPSEYRTKMPQDAGKLHEVLAGSICPDSMFDDDYSSFLEARAIRLARHAATLAEA